MKICMIGAFGFENVYKYSGGQPVKTREIYKILSNMHSDNVVCCDTYEWRKKPISFLFSIIKSAYKSDAIVMLPAKNGLKVFSLILNCFKKTKKLYYFVIGGWLPDFVENHILVCKILKRFDGIYVETNIMKNSLELLKFNNVSVIPNCKSISSLNESELIYVKGEPHKLCTFSRVMKEKGIEDAVNVVKEVNEKYGRIVYTLDIYGSVDSCQTEWFEKIKNNFPEFIRYGGHIPFDQSVEVLKQYYALLFPTRFYTEGIPGTIIDAYAAGVPVISSKWESFSDMIDENITGIGYEFSKNDDLKNILISIAENPDIMLKMKKACLEKAEMYTVERIVDILHCTM